MRYGACGPPCSFQLHEQWVPIFLFLPKILHTYTYTYEYVYRQRTDVGETHLSTAYVPSSTVCNIYYIQTYATITKNLLFAKPLTNTSEERFSFFSRSLALPLNGSYRFPSRKLYFAFVLSLDYISLILYRHPSNTA